MFVHKGEPLIDASTGDPNDGVLAEMKIATSNIQTDERPDIDPLTTAALLLKSRAVRLEQFRAGESEIDDVSWHILLDLMVSMNMGKPVTAHDLAITHDLAINTTSRYVEYLRGIGLVDRSIDGGSEEWGPLRLTASGDALTTDALRKIGPELASL